MKKISILMTIAAFIIGGAIFYSCNKEEVQTHDIKKGNVLKAEQAGDYFMYSENPLCLGEEVVITFDNTQGYDHSNFQMQVWGPEGSEYIGVDDDGVTPTWFNVTNQLSSPSGGKVTFTFTPDVAGEYRFRGQWVRTGNPRENPGESTGWQEANPVLTVEVCGCDDYFALEDVSGCGDTERYAEFLYIAGEDGKVKIQGGLTGGPNGAAGTTSQVWVNGVEVGELNYGVTAGHVHNWIGTLKECDEVVIKIWWTATTEEIIDDWTVARWDEELEIYVDIEGMVTEEVDCK
jgi:hypothetical protein